MTNLRDAIASIPENARAAMIAGLALPVLMMIHMVAPAAVELLMWDTPDHLVAPVALTAQRLAGTLSLGLMGVILGNLLEHSRPRSITAAIISSVSVFLATAVSAVLLVPWIFPSSADDGTVIRMAWKMGVGLQQAWMVVGWGVVAWSQTQWLSRAVTRGVFTVSAVGLTWFVFVNALVVDPAIAAGPAEWLSMARTIGARTVSPWVEPTLAAAVVAIVTYNAVKWIGRCQPQHPRKHEPF